ncbi:hypothetical protein PHLCEN_2v10317 [Hermanssonia centrifuga]|uniref:Uncharacterized protein n=1 Tax=Hermanssonia centrifuga TaxID=98765 RepID=A0A2R6NN87_9APHY|nr:hypothetical protein PHLCEN_2v10317 [Hermanssonia centrifuga]
MDNWIERLTAQMASHYDNTIISLAQQVTALLMMVQTQQALVLSYKHQVDALPTSAGGGHSRQPKIGPVAYLQCLLPRKICYGSIMPSTPLLGRMVSEHVIAPCD